MQGTLQLHLPRLSVSYVVGYVFSEDEIHELHVLIEQDMVKESQLRFGEVFSRVGLVEKVSSQGDLWWQATDLLRSGQETWEE